MSTGNDRLYHCLFLWVFAPVRINTPFNIWRHGTLSSIYSVLTLLISFPFTSSYLLPLASYFLTRPPVLPFQHLLPAPTSACSQLAPTSACSQPNSRLTNYTILPSAPRSTSLLCFQKVAMTHLRLVFARAVLPCGPKCSTLGVCRPIGKL
jgi:hypothetical protein